MTRVKGKTCIVTGVALGIGQACPRRLAGEGAHLALPDVPDEAEQALADESKFMTGAQLVTAGGDAVH